ncbi:MAG: hypothetical protein EOO01_37665 [Chitinophagaceae bacterium]|nr:MAG: hypothetical protein EOO01_37665 [Chitinophagaceae bacterium]
MTSSEFDALPISVQFDLMTRNGVKVGQRNNDFYLMKLYRLFKFHVEVKKCRSTGEVFFSTIDHDVLLVPYLEQIDLKGLLI